LDVNPGAHGILQAEGRLQPGGGRGMTRYDYLIVGGGMTADAAARGIRDRDHKGTIGIIGADPHPPYNRPPLTKGLWKADAPDSIWRKTEEANVDLHLGRRVQAVDGASRRVTDDHGTTYEYRRLLLATGGEPRRLPDAPEGVIYLRTLDDYRATRQLADRGAGFVVLGGGFIGAEIAAALRTQGREVTMIVPGQGLGGRVFPVELSRFLVGYYRELGVRMQIGKSAERVERRNGRFVVHAQHGGAIVADAVIAGLGIVPSVELARQVGLTVSDGIEVDERLGTSQPGIYAAGDVAQFFNPALGKRMRVEHEDNANTMGKVAGQNMAGAELRYEHLPSFYSDLFDLGYEAVGDVDARLETIVDWKEEFREGVVYYLDGGRVRGVLLWNTWGQVDAARELIAQPGPFRPEQLKGRLPAGQSPAGGH
jgi:3-phenylpropionate/trans-cinnamate dioxygenase ferredoxin reductase component